MATYIKGVTDVVPKLAPIKVDYDLLSKSLGALQNRYNQGFDAVKNMYTSLINSELSSTDNEQFRSDYLKKADAALSQLSGVDLANPGNITKATSLFDPLVEDKQYTRDLYLTKVQNAQIQKMLSVKNSTDEKVRTQYNPIMEQYLMLGKERLSGMKRDNGSIEKANAHMFSPWEDPVAYASSLAKEQGLKFELDTTKGMYIVKEINGSNSLGPFKNWFRATIGNKFDNQFRIEAEVDAENAIKGLMSSNPTLDRATATKQLATTYSDRYVEIYNEQLSDVQARINELDSKKRVIQNRYPKSVPPQIAAQLKEMKAEKDKLEDGLTKLRAEKGDDAQFKQRAIDIFMNNPAGAYMSEVKDRYANRFALKESTKYERTIRADEVALHNDRQAHEWSMAKWRDERDKENAYLKFKYDYALEAAKGTVKSSQVTPGPVEDIGKYSPQDYYQAQVVDAFNKGTSAFVDDKVLAVAANLPIGGSGILTLKSGQQLNFADVQSAIRAKSTGTAITQDQANALNSYIQLVAPGSKLRATTASFPDLQNLITPAIRKNSNNYPEWGKVALKSVYDANVARNQYGQYWLEASEHLGYLYNTKPDMRKYIKQNSLGGLDINYAEVNKLDEEDRDAVYATLIPTKSYDRAKAESAKQMQTITLNPSDPDKFDFSLLRSVIDNAETAGVNSLDGFKKYDAKQMAQLRNITLGAANLKEVFDPNQVRYARKIRDGVEYVEVTMPVIREKSGKGSMATIMGFDLNGEIEKSNQITFRVPLNKGMNLAPADITIPGPDGKPVKMPNQLKSLLQGMVGQSLIPEPQSWVTTNGLLKNGVSPFPKYLESYVDAGSIYREGNSIYAQSITDDGYTKLQNLTDELGITFEELARNPAQYDNAIRSYIEKGLMGYKNANMAAAHNQINNNAIKGATEAGWVKWNNINWD